MSKEWATPTWYLFHTIGERINSSYFNSHLTECKYLIQIICNNLPCPICQNHATIYLRKTNFNNIKTLAQFKEYLYIFHNFVNSQLGKKKFTKEEMEKYKRANIDKIMILFYTNLKQDIELELVLVDGVEEKAMSTIRSTLLKMRPHMV